VSFPGEEVNSYLDTLAKNNRSLHREFGGLDQVGRLACEAILPHVPAASRQRYILKIYAQLLLFTYPFWLMNYRQNGVYRAAVNLALGCYPPNLVRVADVSLFVRLYLIVLFAGTTMIGLIVPVGLLRKLATCVLRLSKRFQSRAGTTPETTAQLSAS
jgi:hypothetical protein